MINKVTSGLIAILCLFAASAQAESFEEYKAQERANRAAQSQRRSRSEDNRNYRGSVFGNRSLGGGGLMIPGNGGYAVPIGGGNTSGSVSYNQKDQVIGIRTNVPYLGQVEFATRTRKGGTNYEHKTQPTDAQYRRDAGKTEELQKENFALRNQLVALQQQNLQMQDDREALIKRIEAAEAKGADRTQIEELENLLDKQKTQLDDQEKQIRSLKRELRDRGVPMPPAPQRKSTESTTPPTEEPVDVPVEMQKAAPKKK